MGPKGVDTDWCNTPVGQLFQWRQDFLVSCLAWPALVCRKCTVQEGMRPQSRTGASVDMMDPIPWHVSVAHL